MLATAEVEDDFVTAAVTLTATSSTFLSRSRLLTGSKAETEMTGRWAANISLGASGSYGGVGMEDEISWTPISSWTGNGCSVFDDTILRTVDRSLGVGIVESATASRVLSETR